MHTFFQVTAPIGLLLLAGAHAAPSSSTKSKKPPTDFTANPGIGPAGEDNFREDFIDSDHFRVYGGNEDRAESALAMLEGAYDCFVGTLDWRSTGLSNNDASDAGPWYKTNLYAMNNLRGEDGVIDADDGFAYLEVLNDAVDTSEATVFEYGQALTYHQKSWVDQSRTVAWWKTVGNWVEDTLKTSSICAKARQRNGLDVQPTDMDLEKIIGDSFQVLVDATPDTGNAAEAWPFLTYLTNNPDNFGGLGQDTVKQMMAKYRDGSNETPFHTLDRISKKVSIGQIVGRYWARMAYVDIGHPSAKDYFLGERANINYANLDTEEPGVYRVKPERQPQYMGANIIPLTTEGSATIRIKVKADDKYVGTVVVFNKKSKKTQYVNLVGGNAAVSIKKDEEASLVIANAPSKPIMYYPGALTEDVQKGLDYSVKISGATVSM